MWWGYKTKKLVNYSFFRIKLCKKMHDFDAFTDDFTGILNERILNLSFRSAKQFSTITPAPQDL